MGGILSTIFSVSPEALCTEDVIYHFHTALLRQDLEVAELLVRAGAEVNTFDHRGWSALHCAASLARLDMIKLLLMNGAAVLARTHTSGHTPSQLLPPDNPAYTQCLAYLACMEECLGTVNNRLTLAAATYKACRADELTISKGDRLFVIRRGDIAENGGGQRMWWCEERAGHRGLRPPGLACPQLKAQLVLVLLISVPIASATRYHQPGECHVTCDHPELPCVRVLPPSIYICDPLSSVQ